MAKEKSWDDKDGNTGNWGNWYGDFPMLFIHCPIAYSKEIKPF